MNTKDLYYMYDELLDDTNDMVYIGVLEYYPSDVFKAIYPEAYSKGIDDWLDNEALDFKDIEERLK